MKKGILSGRCSGSMMALWMLLWLLHFSIPARGQSGQSGDFYWQQNDTGVTISSYYGSAASVTIPSQIEGKPVTEIGADAFIGRSMTSVSIPDTVTNIADYAFYYCSLTSVTIPKNVMTIGMAAFAGCSSLSVISVDPASVTFSSVGGVLLDKSQTTIVLFPPGRSGTYTMPQTVTNVGNFAFYLCNSLTAVGFSTNVTEISDYAFTSCRSLSGVSLPERLTSIGDWAFAACQSLTRLTIPKNVTHIGMGVFAYGAFTDISVDPQSSTFCSTNGALYDKGLSTLIAYFKPAVIDVSLPETLTGIGDAAFYGTTAKTIRVPRGVTNIATTAFTSCSSLTNIQVDSLNSAYSSSDGALFDKARTTLLICPAGKVGKFSIPPGATRIADSAFYDCYSITNVMIPSGVTNIGNNAFSYCSALVSLQIPASVVEIGDEAFFYCQKLKSMFFEGDAPKISPYSNTFYGDDLLTIFTLPEASGWEEEFFDMPVCLWPRMTVQRQGSNVILTWPHGYLQQTTNPITGPWTTRTDVSSPLVVPASNPPKFFRVLAD